MAAKPNTTTIKIAKGGKFDGRVPVVVNGQVHHIKVDEETEVSQAVADALTSADVDYQVIGAKSGVGDAPVTTERRTAIRSHDDAPANLEAPVPELKPTSPTVHIEGDVPVEGLAATANDKKPTAKK